ncbi:cell division protein SepF [Sporolactobacillus shoreicorticis]|uniref:Cell division protein SepF n=1 Tax=Sporolactobacillus shoreicorticis TaxID=1923877 RepID=A0ABW5S8K8_9BACL|nr:cell division protein SepF [Sporolactobacillus shoreicorticis]MCO7128107.1 cell division protein SepF [Sporolactobacillus shoreicorticis]
MGLKGTFKRFFDLEETVERSESPMSSVRESEGGQPAQEQRRMEKSGRIVAIQNVHKQNKVVLVEPKRFEEVEEIVGYLKNKQTIICSLQGTSKEHGQRILDFMGGTAFALNAQIRKIGKNTFLFAPEQVDISGMISNWPEN